MSASLDQVARKPIRVLLVEDSETDALLLGRHFRQAGYQPDLSRVETAEEMQGALSGGGDSWDVVLADYNLPTFSAPAALHLLKRAGADIPFIMMSGAVSEETAVAAMRAGAHDYVSKQNLARLIPAIEREIGEAQARRQRRFAELALRASEERFHRLVEAMPVGLLIFDRDSEQLEGELPAARFSGNGAGPSPADGSRQLGRIAYANQAIERLLGYAADEIGRGIVTVSDLLSAGDQGRLLTAQELLNSGAQAPPFEAACRPRTGDPIPMLVGLTMLRKEGTERSQQFAAFLVDLSEQKRSEEVLRRTEKLAATGRLAASIAHEINNPLEAITNCLYLLTTGQMDANSRQFLQMAQRELDRVTHITTQTLRFYRQSTRAVPTNVNELLDTVIALYEARMRGFSISVEREYDELPPITAYEGEVRQVLANLVGNAVDAMHNSGGRLILRTRNCSLWASGEKGICVIVSDTGSGMSKEVRARIFEPFFSTKGITGTGLGLWISQGILQKHHATVQVRSRPADANGGPSGTTFRVFFPYRLAP